MDEERIVEHESIKLVHHDIFGLNAEGKGQFCGFWLIKQIEDTEIGLQKKRPEVF